MKFLVKKNYITQDSAKNLHQSENRNKQVAAEELLSVWSNCWSKKHSWTVVIQAWADKPSLRRTICGVMARTCPFKALMMRCFRVQHYHHQPMRKLSLTPGWHSHNVSYWHSVERTYEREQKFMSLFNYIHPLFSLGIYFWHFDRMASLL